MPDAGAHCRMLQTARNPDDIRWLPGARMNIAESALSMRDPDAPALIWAAEEAPAALRTLSLGELRREALRFSAALRRAGFSAGGAIALHQSPLCDTYFSVSPRMWSSCLTMKTA